MNLDTGFNIEWIATNKIKPAVYNPRKDLQPGDLEYIKIQKSLNEFGLVDPLVVNKDMTLIGGHQRLKVLQDAGFDKVPCSIVDLDKTKEKALNIALNRITGQWDFPKLNDLLIELDTGDFDMEVVGYTEDELKGFLAGVQLPDPKPQKEPHLDSECFIEIYCSKMDMEGFTDTLTAWMDMDGVTINIS